MSDNEIKDNETNALQEVQNRVTITPEDCQGAADFWTHFQVPMPTSLQLAFETFAKDPTFANQQEVKIQVCRAIAHTQHEAFQDEMFKEIVEECRNVSDTIGFDRTLETMLIDNKE